MDYQVKFEFFEGPLDLLLYLIKKEEVDIHEVNLTKLATEFVEYIEMMRMLDLEVAGEFLVMAATLMYIKSRELLPVDQQTVPEGEEEDQTDPRWELIRQLVEYKKFKDTAGQLQQLEERQEHIFSRRPAKPEFEPAREPTRAETSIFELLNALNLVLKRMRDRQDLRDIFEDRWTVSQKIEEIVQRLASKSPSRFSDLFAAATSRMEVVATFLALLELIRLKQILVIQQEAFGEIEIHRSMEPASTAAGSEAVDQAAGVSAT